MSFKCMMKLQDVALLFIIIHPQKMLGTFTYKALLNIEIVVMLVSKYCKKIFLKI